MITIDICSTNQKIHLDGKQKTLLIKSTENGRIILVGFTVIHSLLTLSNVGKIDIKMHEKL